MNADINNRCALVLGASKGIGKGIAMGLAEEGGVVCIVARNETTLEKAHSDIGALTSAPVYSIAADVSKPEDVGRVFAYAQEKMGKIDILINNAGGPKFGTLSTLVEADWQEAINLTLMSAIRMTSLAVPEMCARRWGRIVTVTSTIAREPSANMILSATMRAGVSSFMKALASDLAPKGVTVNVVAPGGVLTDRIYQLLQSKAQSEKIPYEDLLRQSEASIPLGRFATPEEFASYVVFLCSDDARYITGTTLNVDGGLSKGMF